MRCVIARGFPLAPVRNRATVHARLSRRTIRAADVALVLWLALWIVLAALVYRDLRHVHAVDAAWTPSTVSEVKQ